MTLSNHKQYKSVFALNIMIIKRIFKPANFMKDFLIAERFPLKAQKKVLDKILMENRNTLYGKKYGFSKIKTIDEFQKQLPIITYVDIKKYIDLMRIGDQNILVRDKVLFFATSSGTTSDPKFIPVTKKRMEFHRGEFLLWINHMLKTGLKITKGKLLYFAGGDLNGYTEAKIPYGNISGYLVKNSSVFAKNKLVVSSDILNIQDFDKKMEVIAVKSLLEKNVSQIAFASAVQAILFFDFLTDHREKLIELIKKKDKKRAKVLKELKVFNPISIWPKLWLINCIKAGSNASYLEVVKEKLGKKDVIIRDPGVLASEGRVSLGITELDRAGVIPANESFFEFREKVEDGFKEPVTIDKLRKNKEYKVLMTTMEGLYRYDLEDVVKVVGFRKKLPLVRFVSRNKFLNVTEEHAPEGEIIRGVEDALKKLKIKARSFTVIPYIEIQKRPRYEILIETILPLTKTNATKLLKEIDKNWQKYMLTYAETRNEFGRMDPPILSIVKKGSYDKIDAETLVRRGQAKPINVTEDKKYRTKFKIEKTFGL